MLRKKRDIYVTLRNNGVALFICCFLTACIADRPEQVQQSNSDLGLMGTAPSYRTSGKPAASSTVAGAADTRLPASGFAELGTGTFVGQNAQANTEIDDSPNPTKASLNFVNADIQEFTRVVFDEVLKQNVVIDPAVTGRVTVRSSAPADKKVALDMVRQVLEMNNAILSKQGNTYRVAIRGDRQMARGASKESIRILPVRFIDPVQAKTALQPFAASGTEITANNEGRYLVVAGADVELASLEQVLATLDVDQMKGRSLALVPLKEANAGSVARELGQMFGNEQGARSFQAMPIQRMNAVLLISQVPQSILRARQWMEHLDHADKDGRRVFVYQVQNRRATELATVLTGMFANKAEAERGLDNPVAPSLTTTRAQTANFDKLASAAPAQAPVPDSAPTEEARASPDKQNLPVQVRADPSTNALVVMAKPDDYERVERAIRSLDVLPTQVLIEATIAEVTLNEALQHGVQWYLQSGHHAFSLSGDSSGSTAAVNPGFNYAFGVQNAKVVINALEAVTDVEVISSPTLTVLNNQTATLKVGDQVPMITSTSQSTVTANAPIVNNIELKDTGIILSVTPRVNGSGVVVLDISQEASEVVPTTTSSINSPTIRQRKINSSVAVQSGTEIVLGGLIQANRQTEKDGLPWLKDVPLVGTAFTSKADRQHGRTELLILIRPTVLGTRADIQSVTQEIKSRMRNVTKGSYY
ncbi:type II secretion system protein D (GspD) [Rhizobiales bacterium GAS191]|nr:type II secretion system protein D (GspD) [Rhizobiales bacterium GAS191]